MLSTSSSSRLLKPFKLLRIGFSAAAKKGVSPTRTLSGKFKAYFKETSTFKSTPLLAIPAFGFAMFFSTSAVAPEGSNSPSAEPINSSVVLDATVHQIAGPNKKHKAGEDAYMISKDKRTVGVFDGVGGWNDVGVDPRLYAVKLAEGCSVAADSEGITDPQQILVYAHKHAMKVRGSSTACVVTVIGEEIVGANLGDSGYMIYRGSDIIFRSTEQQHMFNFPFQLGSESSDLPKHADITKTKAQIGDLIIAATDGFFDNMFDDHITEVLKQQLNGGSVKDLQGPHLAELAQALSEAAFKQGQSKSAVTPFSAHARQSGYRYQGGKPDDITVLVATVRTEEQAKQSEALRIARPKL